MSARSNRLAVGECLTSALRSVWWCTPRSVPNERPHRQPLFAMAFLLLQKSARVAIHEGEAAATKRCSRFAPYGAVHGGGSSKGREGKPHRRAHPFRLTAPHLPVTRALA